MGKMGKMGVSKIDIAENRCSIRKIGTVPHTPNFRHSVSMVYIMDKKLCPKDSQVFPKRSKSRY
jgi:hypothetical protein